MNELDALNWRYATKNFDANKNISRENLDKILEAFRLSPSSYGLQAWKLLVIKDKKIREELLEYAWGQRQVVDSSVLLVLTRIDNFTTDNVDKYVESIINIRGLEKNDLESYSQMMKGTVTGLTEDQKNCWLEKQVYIALGNLISFCANIGIDSCPMEGFMREKFDEVLGLKEKGLKSVVMLPIGYRSQEDAYAKLKKVRFSKDEVIIEI